ncbi:MAG: imidazole glycerol phosphate synthase subunit HisH [Candidatus Hydrogenedentota bacterium]
MITILDIGMGNIGSIVNMFRRLGRDATVASDPGGISGATRIILPGVGAFDEAMQALERGGWIAPLEHAVRDRGIPILGICLGFQILGRSSEEGVLPGLGWLEAKTRKLDAFPGLKIPHMGWNAVTPPRPSPLSRHLDPDARFYFVHSYHVVADRDEDVIFRTTHGQSFVSGMQRGHIMGVQFHPEKSRKFGMALLRDFSS